MMSAAGGGGLNVNDVFSTYIYTGTNSSDTDTQQIVNGLDLSTEGGMVWFKGRDISGSHGIVDTERGGQREITTNNADGETDVSSSSRAITFNTDGFTISGAYLYFAYTGNNNSAFVSWSFRKAPKFFDVVTYTGNGTAGRTVSHNLGSVPGCIMVKRLDSTDNWAVYHRGMHLTTPEDYYMELNTTDGRKDNTARWNDTAPTSSVFTVGTAGVTNASGGEYVAYIFAHNDGDGEFGPTGDKDIIKCGGFESTANTRQYVDLGFEPQWLMIKRYDGSSQWYVVDSIRDLPAMRDPAANDPTAQTLYVGLTNQEAGYSVQLTENGFTMPAGQFSGFEEDYLYIAIARDMDPVIDAPSDFFNVDEGNSGLTPPTGYLNSGWPVDMALEKRVDTTDEFNFGFRKANKRVMRVDEPNFESTNGNAVFDRMNGWWQNQSANNYSWMWRRKTGFFDVVTYTGNTAARNIDHKLGAVPEMMWVKNREDNFTDWIVYHKDLGNTKYVQLNRTNGPVTSTDMFNNTTPTSSVFTIGGDDKVNGNDDPIVCMLYATYDGFSKVGSYTGNGGSNQVINCGFSNGARFVFVKSISGSGAWFVWDTERGINAGTEPYTRFNTSLAHETTYDAIDYNSSGFALNNVGAGINTSSEDYIFYAVAAD